jgi:hypothetical protein
MLPLTPRRAPLCAGLKGNLMLITESLSQQRLEKMIGLPQSLALHRAHALVALNHFYKFLLERYRRQRNRHGS